MLFYCPLSKPQEDTRSALQVASKMYTALNIKAEEERKKSINFILNINSFKRRIIPNFSLVSLS